MPRSDYVYTSGRSVTYGDHGQHDYVFHSGEPVPDTGESNLVYESGVGLGSTGALVMRYGEDSNNFGGTGKIDQALDEVLGAGSNQVFQQDTALDEALDSGTYGMFVVTCESNPDSLTSSETSALSDWWENEAEQGMLVLGEHGSARAGLMNDLIEACVGSRPYDESGYAYDRVADYGGSNDGCLSPAVPTGYNAALENISTTTAFNSEGTTRSPDDDRGTFWQYDQPAPDPRIYADGSYTRFAETWDCADNQQYTTQCIEWLNRDR